MAATHPDRVERLVVHAGFARLLQGPGYPEGVPPDLADDFVQLMVDEWGTGLIFGEMFIDCPAEDRATMAQFERNACTPQMAAAIMRANYGIDCGRCWRASSRPRW